MHNNVLMYYRGVEGTSLSLCRRLMEMKLKKLCVRVYRLNSKEIFSNPSPALPFIKREGRNLKTKMPRFG